MSDHNNVTLHTFPSDRVSALTILYMQSHDFSDLTPEELVDEYLTVYEKINARFKEKSKSKSASWFSQEG